MPKAPEISVIIPVHNSAINLYQCLDSIRLQTFSDIEIICVNDGSTDHSLAILEEFAAKDSRFTIIDKYSSGFPSARNTGLDAAKGKYVLFVESSDWIAHQLCERTHYKAEEWKAEMVFFNMLPFDQQGMFFDCLFKYPKINGCFEPTSVPQLLTCPTASNRLFRRDLIKDMRFIEGIIMEGRPFSAEASIRAKRALLLDEALYYCRRERDLKISRFEHIDHAPFFQSVDAVRSVFKKYGLNDTLYEWVIGASDLEIYMRQIKSLYGRHCRTFFSMAHQRTRRFIWDKVTEVSGNMNGVPLLRDRTYTHFIKCLRRGGFWRYSFGLLVRNWPREKHLLFALPVVGRFIEWCYMLVSMVKICRHRENMP